MPRIVQEWELEGIMRKGGHKEMDGVRQNTANHGLTEVTRERDRWRT